jgi:hypothetical protein
MDNHIIDLITWKSYAEESNNLNTPIFIVETFNNHKHEKQKKHKNNWHNENAQNNQEISPLVYNSSLWQQMEAQECKGDPIKFMSSSPNEALVNHKHVKLT